MQFHLSGSLSVTPVDQSKTVQARITNKSSTSAAWKTLVSESTKLFHKFKTGHQKQVRKNCDFQLWYRLRFKSKLRRNCWRQTKTTCKQKQLWSVVRLANIKWKTFNVCFVLEYTSGTNPRRSACRLFLGEVGDLGGSATCLLVFVKRSTSTWRLWMSASKFYTDKQQLQPLQQLQQLTLQLQVLQLQQQQL